MFFVSNGPVQGAVIGWDGGGASQNWSETTNWDPDGSPSGNDVTFTNIAAVGTQGTVNSIVDSDVSINGLLFRNTTANYHTFQINPGVTLTVNGTTGFEIDPGRDDANGGSSQYDSIASITGAGSFVVNNASASFSVGSPTLAQFTQNTHVGILDMSGLANFQANVNIFNVGHVKPYGTGFLTLGTTNTITANTVNVGGWGNFRKNPAAAFTPSQLNLGEVNQINTDNLRLSHTDSISEAGSIVQMRSGLINPTVTIRDKSGTGRAALSMSTGNAGGGQFDATLNLNGATVDALFSTVIMGVGRPNHFNAIDVATITFNKGVIDAQTVTLGQSPVGATSTNFNNTARGILNIQGTGTFIADTIYLGDVNGAGTNTHAQGYINLQDNGTLRATTIDKGPGTGAGKFVRQFNWSGGTIQNKAGTDLTITAAVPITMTNNTTHTFRADAGRTITVHSVIQDSAGVSGGGLTKTGGGTLTLNAANTYSGATVVSAGKLLVNGSLNSSANNVQVQSGGTLGGTGTINRSVDVEAGGTLAPGESSGILHLTELTLSPGSTLSVELNGTTVGSEYDQLDVTGTASIADSILSISMGFEPNVDDQFTLLNNDDVDAIDGTFFGLSEGGFVDGSSNGFDAFFNISYAGGTGNDIVLTATVPEPSSLLLIGLSGLLLFWRRR